MDELAADLNLTAPIANVEISRFTERFEISGFIGGRIPRAIHKPVLIQTLADSGKLIEFVRALCPDGSAFLLQCMASDVARAAVVGEALSAGR